MNAHCKLTVQAGALSALILAVLLGIWFAATQPASSGNGAKLTAAEIGRASCRERV